MGRFVNDFHIAPIVALDGVSPLRRLLSGESDPVPSKGAPILV